MNELKQDWVSSATVVHIKKKMTPGHNGLILKFLNLCGDNNVIRTKNFVNAQKWYEDHIKRVSELICYYGNRTLP